MNLQFSRSNNKRTKSKKIVRRKNKEVIKVIEEIKKAEVDIL